MNNPYAKFILPKDGEVVLFGRVWYQGKVGDIVELKDFNILVNNEIID
jgi:polyphosphate kinase 2 (PPK2 family)